MTLAEVNVLLAAISATWPRFTEKVATDALKLMPGIWHDALEDIDAAAAVDALKVHRATSVWPPTIADIRRIVAERAAPVRRIGADAWGDVQLAIQRWGASNIPQFDDPIVARAVRSLGWRNLCLSNTQAADRARFCECYDAMAATATADAVLPPTLRRLEESTRGQRGYLPDAARRGQRTLNGAVLALLGDGDEDEEDDLARRR
jgi:hypothetical protein